MFDKTKRETNTIRICVRECTIFARKVLQKQRSDSYLPICHLSMAEKPFTDHFHFISTRMMGNSNNNNNIFVAVISVMNDLRYIMTDVKCAGARPHHFQCIQVVRIMSFYCVVVASYVMSMFSVFRTFQSSLYELQCNFRAMIHFEWHCLSCCSFFVQNLLLTFIWIVYIVYLHIVNSVPFAQQNSKIQMELPEPNIRKL